MKIKDNVITSHGKGEIIGYEEGISARRYIIKISEWNSKEQKDLYKNKPLYYWKKEITVV